MAIEVRGDPAWSGDAFGVPLTLNLGAGAEIDGNADFWAGIGLAVQAGAPEGWRLEAAFFPGFHAEGDGEDLGTDFPMFRSSIGVSRPLAPGWRGGVSISHKSNASAAARNPGVETLLFSIHRTF